MYEPLNYFSSRSITISGGSTPRHLVALSPTGPWAAWARSETARTAIRRVISCSKQMCFRPEVAALPGDEPGFVSFRFYVEFGQHLLPVKLHSTVLAILKLYKGFPLHFNHARLQVRHLKALPQDYSVFLQFVTLHNLARELLSP